MERITDYERLLTRGVRWYELEDPVRHYGWKQLMAWPDAVECRAAVGAIVSCALRESSPLYYDSRTWLHKHTTSQLVQAVLLQEARHSSDTFTEVLKLLIDFDIELPSKARSLQRAIGRKVTVTWPEIVSTVDLDTWQNLPPLNRPDLYRTICRVAEDPTVAMLASRVNDLIHEVSTLDDLPFLRFCLLETLVWAPDRDAVLPLIANGFEKWAKSLIELLQQAQSYDLRRPPSEKTDGPLYAVGIKAMVTLVSDNLGQIPAEDRIPLIEPLTLLHGDSIEDWIYVLAPMLCQYMPEWDQLPQQLVRASKKGDHTWFANAVPKLPPSQAARTLGCIIANDNRMMYSHRGEHDPQSIFRPLMLRDPAVYLDILGKEVESGHGDTTFVADWVEAIGLDPTQSALVQWLATTHTGIDHQDPRILRWVVEFKLPAGRLLEQSSRMYDRGYRFQAADLASDEQVIRILPHEYERGLRKFKPTGLWRNDDWRVPLLDCGHAEEEVLYSLLSSVPTWEPGPGTSQKFQLGWLEKHLVPHVEIHAGLRAAFCRLAWSLKNGQRLARALLIRDDRLARWMSPDDHTAMRAYLKSNIRWMLGSEPEVARFILDEEEQLQSLFGLSLTEDTNIHLPSLDGYRHLFPGETQRRRLMVWLLRHSHRINGEKWIEWVSAFELNHDPQVIRVIDRLVDDRDPETSRAALAILNPAEA
jgi:hypothetical protein